MSTDPYPTEDELDKVKVWPYNDPHGLLNYLRDLWWQPEWGWTEYEGKEQGDPVRVVMASTGGWSGNEDLMGALASNFVLYSQMFVSYRRGGHYHLQIPAKCSCGHVAAGIWGESPERMACPIHRPGAKKS